MLSQHHKYFIFISCFRSNISWGDPRTWKRSRLGRGVTLRAFPLRILDEFGRGKYCLEPNRKAPDLNLAMMKSLGNRMLLFTDMCPKSYQTPRNIVFVGSKEFLVEQVMTKFRHSSVFGAPFRPQDRHLLVVPQKSTASERKRCQCSL